MKLYLSDEHSVIHFIPCKATIETEAEEAGLHLILESVICKSTETVCYPKCFRLQLDKSFEMMLYIGFQILRLVQKCIASNIFFLGVRFLGCKAIKKIVMFCQ